MTKEKEEKKKKVKPPAVTSPDSYGRWIRGDYVERKIMAWTRMGTPSEMSPKTGGARPKWKGEQDDR